MKERILVVDDEANVLSAMQRSLRKYYDVYCASGGMKALEILDSKGPFPVIVSDMRMPEMDGAELLKIVAQVYPDSTRIMLTGNADQETATKAINDGKVFQFINKPINLHQFVRIVQKGISAYDLKLAERELLEQTLKGSIQVLVDLLSIANPLAFTRAMRIKDYTRQVCQTLAVRDVWQHEIAAMLSHIAYVTIPQEVLEKEIANEKLTDVERHMVEHQPKMVIELIGHIPRLEPVIQIIEGLVSPPLAAEVHLSSYNFGACLLNSLFQFDTLLLKEHTIEQALEQLSKSNDCNQAEILEAMALIQPPEYNTEHQLIPVGQVAVGMIINEEIRINNGMLITNKGTKITSVLKKQLLNFYRRKDIPSTIRVRLPKSEVLAMTS